MLHQILAGFYERDLRSVIQELQLFKDEKNLWKTTGTIRNSSGNLALHLIGGLNYLIGTQLAHTGYKRNRDMEFIQKDVPREELVKQLEAVIQLITQTLKGFDSSRMEADYPIPFDDDTRSNSYVLVQLLAHINYHLGQINYLRRTLE
jgi:hypothetical protein